MPLNDSLVAARRRGSRVAQQKRGTYSAPGTGSFLIDTAMPSGGLQFWSGAQPARRDVRPDTDTATTQSANNRSLAMVSRDSFFCCFFGLNQLRNYIVQRKRVQRVQRE